MNKQAILDPNESYTFSKYAEMSFDIVDILAAFDVKFNAASIAWQQHLPIDSESLRNELQENIILVDPTSEIARRETLIFPILKTICKFLQYPLKIEYQVKVSAWLKGSFDYFIPGHNLIVIEAKNADLAKGFTQLAVELIALDQWINLPSANIYGAVTTGDTWKFGIFQRAEKIIKKDTNTYAVPVDLDRVLSILFGMGLNGAL